MESFELKSADGTGLYAEVVRPEGTPRAALLIVHGFAEHLGRYHAMMGWFAERGYLVYAVDVRGHGRSEGIRSFISNFSEYLDDVDALVSHVSAESPDLPRFVIGHSQGGLVVLKAALRNPDLGTGIILSAPAMRFAVSVPLPKRLLGLAMSKLWPTLAIPAGVPSEHICRDPEICRAYENDSLVNKNATCRWYTEILEAQQDGLGRAVMLKVPALVLHPQADKIIDPASVRAVYERMSVEDKALKTYPDLYHEVFNEPERETVFADVLSWIEAHH